jgi:glycerol-1-phosphate dehydrogenase [NAD(P)+]
VPASSPAVESVDVGTLLAEVDPDGTTAPCRLRSLLLGDVVDEVVATVGELLGGVTSGAWVVLLVDAVPILRDGTDLKEAVAARLGQDHDVVVRVLDDGSPELHVVDEVLDRATSAVTGADAVVALGGGTISDIGKVAVARARGEGARPVLLTLQTAASVDGYTDDVSVVLRGGVKRTVPSCWPDAVLADSVTIAGAPARMNSAGFGEMTSMLVAPADWRLAALVGVDPTFQEGPVRLLGRLGADLGSFSHGVAAADPDAVAQLTRALALRGIATGIAGTTAVLSGMEHLVSHMLDQHHSQHHLPMGLHGAQVGVASVVAAAAWEMLVERLDAGRPADVRVDHLQPDAARARVESAFGHLDEEGRVAAECLADYGKKATTITAHLDDVRRLLAAWSDHRADLTRLLTPSSEIAAGLRAAGTAVTFEELDPRVGPELARWAVESCALMRNRFTVVDLLDLLGWWESADVDEVMDRAERAVAAADAMDRVEA